MNVRKRYSINDALELITAGDQSELSDFSDDEESEITTEQQNNKSSKESGEDVIIDDANDDDVDDETDIEDMSVDASFAVESMPGIRGHTFIWRKNDIPAIDDSFRSSYSDPPQPELTPLHYFKMFFTDEAVILVAEQTNLYSVQKTCKSIDISETEIATVIGMYMLMGIVKLPSYKNYWSQKLRYPVSADAMPSSILRK